MSVPLIRRLRLFVTAAALSAAGVPSSAGEPARGAARGAAYVDDQRWFHLAEVMANEAVTYEMCGWGPIDLRSALLRAAIRDEMDALAWDELIVRFNHVRQIRWEIEAVLTAHGENDPADRTTGLFPTAGCSAAVRERIERRAADPLALAADVR